jgi:hypothetical protein
MTYVLRQRDSIDMLLRTVIKSHRRESRCDTAQPEQPQCGRARGRIGFSMLGMRLRQGPGYSPEYPFEGRPACGM